MTAERRNVPENQENAAQSRAVLITGASSGIGAALARLYAAEHRPLVLVARNRQRLEALALDLQVKAGCPATVLVQDLAEPGAAKTLVETVQALGIDVEILVNNAGAGCSKTVLDTSATEIASMIELNIKSLTELSRLFAADMVRRGRGQILNVASTGAYQPGPYTAIYYAAKAYVHSFSLALDRELQGTGVHVTLLCPGATATEFSRRAGKADIAGAMHPETVARAAIRGLSRHKRLVIPGLANRLVIVLSKILPGHMTAALVARIQKPLLLDH